MAMQRMKRRKAISGGIVAGIVGGLALWSLLLLATVLQDGDVWTVFKGASTPFFRARSAQPGFDIGPVLIGTAFHFAISIGWGVLFGLIFNGLRKGATLAAGVIWGVIVWLVMFYVLLPVVGMTAMVKSVPVPFAVFEHVFFGFFVALGFLPFQRPVQRTAPPLERREPVHP